MRFLDGVLIRRGLLVGPLRQITPDVIFEIKSPRGRRRFVLVFRSLYADELEIENSDPIEHSANFRQLYLKQGSAVVGSILEVASNYCFFTKTSVSYTLPNETLQQYLCPVEGHSGGLLIYEDGRGSFFAMPSTVPNSTLLVKDEKDIV